MKVAILSDFHLGYARFREDAFRQAGEALELAAQKADVLLIPGDIFDSRRPDPDVLAEAINLFRDLSKREWSAKVIGFDGEGRRFTSVPVIAIPGTHERTAEGVADPVDLLGLAGLLVDATNASVVVEMGGEKIAVRGLGGIADDRFREIVKRENPKPAKGMFSILFFHQSVYELLPFSKDFITIDELPDGFDLYVNGHIHNRVETTAHGKPFLVPGSTVLTQLKAGEQEPKGFFVYDTLKKEYSFSEIKSRRFVSLKMNVDGKVPASIEEGIEELIKKNCGGDRPIIRIELAGRIGDGYRNLQIESQEIIKRYSDSATVEIDRHGMNAPEVRSADSGQGVVLADGASIKDFGLGVFAERLKQNKYALDKNPRELFDVLSSDESKEKIVKKAVGQLLD